MLLDPSGRYVICNITTENDLKFCLCALYAPNADTPAFFDAISQNIMDFESKKIIIGDYNLVIDPAMDRYGSEHNNHKSSAKLREIMEELNLCELWRCRNSMEHLYSWARGNQASRIDFTLVSHGLDSMCENITYLQGVGTDHMAIFLSI